LGAFTNEPGASDGEGWVCDPVGLGLDDDDAVAFGLAVSDDAIGVRWAGAAQPARAIDNTAMPARPADPDTDARSRHDTGAFVRDTAIMGL
jgi:hypothetical protein